MAPNLEVKLPRGTFLRDPLVLSSGCWAFPDKAGRLTDLKTIGGAVTKGLTPQARPGNPGKRLLQLPTGWMNSNGLQNPGLEAFTEEVLPQLFEAGFGFFVNVVGETVEEYAELVRRVDSAAARLAPADTAGQGHGLLGFEINMSCPNVKHGAKFATDPGLLGETIAACRAQTQRLMSAKLSPNVTEMRVYAEAAARAGADAVTISNTWNSVFIDTKTRQSYFHRPSAGMSGAAVRPIVLYHVWKTHQALPELPIFASGGVVDSDSAIQYLLAGASVVQIGSGLFSDPQLPAKVQAGLIEYLEEQGESSVADIVGTYKTET
ncbi:hypothetical protein IT575_09010 [bacterium]|nr:hypothetical protein [bacterium]